MHLNRNVKVPHQTATAKPVTGLFARLVLIMMMLWPVTATAHELRPAIATLELAGDGQLTVKISLNLEAAIAGIGAGHQDTSQSPQAQRYDHLRALAPAALGLEFDDFARQFLERITLSSDTDPVPLSIKAADIPETGDQTLPRFSNLLLKGSLPSGTGHLIWHVDPKLGDSVIRLKDPASDKILASQFVIAGEASKPLLTSGIDGQTTLSVFLTYLKVGFTHIVPKGLDHILFVVGLFLLSTRFSALLWQVTAFTVAHTVTLGLSMAGVIQLPPQIVEPLIAASIVYVAVENVLTDRLHYWRPVVVFCFGLLHGLGFAGVLQEIGPAPGQYIVSLLSFNAGVELGQLAVIAACYLLVGWTMGQTWHRRIVVIPASVVIALIAGYWVMLRTGIL